MALCRGELRDLKYKKTVNIKEGQETQQSAHMRQGKATGGQRN